MDEQRPPADEEIAEERRRSRRLRLIVDLTVARLMQEELSRTQALALVEEARRGALALFPGKSLAFEIIYRPRLMRIVAERWPGPPPAGAAPGETGFPGGARGQ